MGLCRDFGSQIAEGCNHLMQADVASCHCDECGVVCKGRFEACPSVWAQGPRPVVIEPPRSLLSPKVGRHDTNGHGDHGPSATDDPVATANGALDGAEVSPVTAPGTETPKRPSIDGAEVRRWFQSTFDSLRAEIEVLRGALSQEQVIVARLIESRVGEAKVDGELLRGLVDAAVRDAVRSEASELSGNLTAKVDGLSGALETVRQSQTDHAADVQRSTEEALANSAGMRESMETVLADSMGVKASMAEAVAQIAGLQASMAAVAASSADVPAELSRHAAGNRKAWRATLREELQALVEVVAESVAQSDHELAALDRKLDRLVESQSALAMALAEVAASVEMLAAGEADGAEPDPGPGISSGSSLGDRLSGTEASPLAARVAANRRRRETTVTPPPTRGTRVSLRSQRPQG
jgi:transposase-like protein